MISSYISPILILSLVAISLVKTIEYTDLEANGVDCPDRVSCGNINSNFSRRNCECDRNCNLFGDCCFDARAQRLTAHVSRNLSYTCMPLKRNRNDYENATEDGVYVIGVCSSNFVGSPDLRQKCLNRTDISDPVSAAPVTDTSTRRTYWNRYCAACNNVNIENTQTWTIRMECGRGNTPNSSVDNVWQNITYRSDSNEWGVYNGHRFQPCDLQFTKPNGLREVRQCRTNLISECPRNYTRSLIKRDCEAYTAVMYTTMYDPAYKNPHCAICNGVNVNDILCVKNNLPRKKPVSVAEIFDFNTNDGDVVGKSVKNCASNQIYDPYFKKCRNKACVSNC